jgi:predicted Zn-ribbon and HTH transcriptional regulator
VITLSFQCVTIYMKILVVPNLLLHYIKLEDTDDEDKLKQKIECIRCGFKMGEIAVCHLKCFRCGSELISSD